MAGIGSEVTALHLHDTRGAALANVMTADLGVRCFDARPAAPAARCRARVGGQPRHRGPRLPVRPGGGAHWRRLDGGSPRRFIAGELGIPVSSR